MSFPDVRVALDVAADELFRRQIIETPTGEAVVLDSSALGGPAEEAAKKMGTAAALAAMAKHMREHSYKSAKNAAKKRGRKILDHMNRTGEWPLAFALEGTVYSTKTGDLYPLRHMTYETYNDDIDEKHRQAKHDIDKVTAAVATKQLLVDRWGNRMLGEVCDELREPLALFEDDNDPDA